MITLNDIVKIYNKGKENEFEALRGISLQIDDGEMVAIMGKSGAGKSTLLHILACIDSYEDGEYYLEDRLIQNLSEKKMAKIRNKMVGLVMQEYALINDFSALENVMLPLDFAKGKIRGTKKKAMHMLEEVGMGELAGKRVSKLSGGQKQRVAIARAMVNQPSVLLADEPTGALDSTTADEIMALFKKLNQSGTTVVIVTHDIGLAKQCGRIIEISDGKLLRE